MPIIDGFFIYLIGTYYWTSFIFIALIALAIVLIILHNKKVDKLNKSEQ
ncbi:MAG: hypothetical protein PUG55_06010 [Bacillales bacterium]|nr:hypothetical protein [Bacillales bacterium]MDY6003287.1 hypothetical protein [Bacilli bacterium]